MYVRNVVMRSLWVGAWHLPLYALKRQGIRIKYNKRWMATNSRGFLFGSQLWDNVFWSLVPGAGIWTVYEALLLWAYAEGWLVITTFRESPVWFVAFFVVGSALWSPFHFYWIHRLIHWKPLYKAAHYLHHRNVNVGPWSSMSMHPLEQVLYQTRWLILFIVPSHPVHMFYLMIWVALGSTGGHIGFHEMVVRKKGDVRMSVDSFFHYFHHRYFECNYGGGDIPYDRWFGTYHDGSPEAHARMRGRIPRAAGGSAGAESAYPSAWDTSTSGGAPRRLVPQGGRWPISPQARRHPHAAHAKSGRQARCQSHHRCSHDPAGSGWC